MKVIGGYYGLVIHYDTMSVDVHVSYSLPPPFLEEFLTNLYEVAYHDYSSLDIKTE